VPGHSPDPIAEAWERGDHESVLRYIELFHGHPGPNAAIGYRAGHLALKHLGAEKHFGVKAIYEGPCRPPESCLADGLQIGTGATAGKANLMMRESAEIALTVEHEETGRRVTFKISPSVLDEVKARFERGVNEPKISLWVMELDEGELFETA